MARRFSRVVAPDGEEPAAVSVMGPLPMFCAYAFLAKGSVNVFFIAAQTAFFGVAGVEGLPYVYTAMNLVYIALQAAIVQRLKARSETYLARLSWAFALLAGLHLATGGGSEKLPAAAFLLAVMVYDLFFNQFFIHHLNEVFTLQEGKTALPAVTAAGSAAFIASGLALKLMLSISSLQAAERVCLGVFVLDQILFAWLRRTANPQERRDSPPPPDRPSGPSEAATPLPALGRAIVCASFLTMAAKYWLDYQYSRAITTAFPEPRELASFIAVFTSTTDLLVVASQAALAPWALRRFRVPVILALMPAVVLASGLLTAATGSVALALATQFLFTYLSKTLHTPASSLLLPVLPAGSRLRLMSASGMASSAGSLLVGLALIVVQTSLSAGVAFLILAAMLAALLAAVRFTDSAHASELERAVERGSEEDRLEAARHLPSLERSARVRLLARLLEGDGASRRCALAGLEGLDPVDTVRLLSPYLQSETDPRLAATALKTLAGAAGAAGTLDVPAMLARAGTNERVLANVVEALGETPAAVGSRAELRPLLASPAPRVRAAAALACVRLSCDETELEQALDVLRTMLDGQAGDGGRPAALAALAALRHEAFLPDFEAALEDPSLPVAGQALAGLALLDHPAAGAALQAYLAGEPAPELRERAERSLARHARLARAEVAQLLDSLTAEERARAGVVLGQMGSDLGSELALRVLGLADPAVRGALCDFLAGCEEPAWLEALQASLPRDSGNVWKPDALREALVTPSAPGPDGLRRLVVALLGHQLHAQAARLVEACLDRLWLLEACLERAAASPDVDPARQQAWRTAVAAERQAGLELAAGLCAAPSRALEAMRRAGGEDRFAASLASEYLQRELSGPHAARSLPLLEATGRGRRCLDGAARQTGVDAAALPPDTVEAYLAGSRGHLPDLEPR